MGIFQDKQARNELERLSTVVAHLTAKLEDLQGHVDQLDSLPIQVNDLLEQAKRTYARLNARAQRAEQKAESEAPSPDAPNGEAPTTTNPLALQLLRRL